MSKAVDIFDGTLFVRTRHYDEVKKVVVLQGEKPEKRFDPERAHRANWLYVPEGLDHCEGWQCSACEETFHTKVPYFSEFKFCPNCGANMVADLCSICKHGDNCERSDKGISFARHITCWKFER